MSYDPTIGRFIQRDPIGYDDGMNPYQFVHGNPVSHVDPSGLYDRSGHYWTVYSVAIAAGKTPPEAYRLAAYAQLPDQSGSLDAVEKQFERAWNGDSDTPKVIQKCLHQLNGLQGNDAIRKNRKCLEKLLKSGKWGGGQPMARWEKGLLAHALGDSYSHVRPHGSEEVAYENHGAAGHWPDLITHNLNNYNGYVDALFGAFGGNPANATQAAALASIKTFAGTLPAEPPDGPTKGLGTKELKKEAELFEQFARRTFGFGASGEQYLPANEHDLKKFPFQVPTDQQVKDFLSKLSAACPC